jgi:hypothetical protein
MAQSLQSAQQSLQQAGQQAAQGQQGQQGQAGQQGEASQAEMGQEFGQGQSASSSSSSSSSDPGKQGQATARGSGRGNPGMGVGGNVGAQQPLPGVKQDKLVKGMQDPNGQKLSRTYMGTPDPTQDKAAYYSIVPDKLKASEATLNREDIPAGYKKQVRDYFESIQPR